MKKQEKSLKDLLIELDTINRQIERINTDPEYIKQRVKEIFGEETEEEKERKRKQREAEIMAILAEF